MLAMSHSTPNISSFRCTTRTAARYRGIRGGEARKKSYSLTTSRYWFKLCPYHVRNQGKQNIVPTSDLKKSKIFRNFIFQWINGTRFTVICENIFFILLQNIIISLYEILAHRTIRQILQYMCLCELSWQVLSHFIFGSAMIRSM